MKMTEEQTFRMTKKIVIAFILMLIGMTMLISSLFINEPAICSASITQTIYSFFYSYYHWESFFNSWTCYG